ncbi:hypothetical protein THIOSC15_2090002 [uncultured Thiomicrorhabdus sp.]
MSKTIKKKAAGVIKKATKKVVKGLSSQKKMKAAVKKAVKKAA